MPDGKLCFRFRRRRPHKHAFEPKSRFHFFRWTHTLAASHVVFVSTNRCDFCILWLLEPCRARQGSNPARTGSRRSGIFGSPRITNNILAPNFWFSQNSRKRCLEANLALFQPCKVPKARTAVLADQSLMRNGLS